METESHILKILETLGALLSMKCSWNFVRVRRGANKVDDLMENVGVGGGNCIREGKLQDFEGVLWVDQCHHLAYSDHMVIGWERMVEWGTRRHLTIPQLHGLYSSHLL